MFRAILLALSVVRSVVVAQQYAGDAIPNSMPKVSGTEIVFFRIPDPSGENNHLTLLNYYTLNSTGQRRLPSKVQKVLIDVPGKNRNPQNYISWLLTAFSQAKGGEINSDTIAMMSILTPNQDDASRAYPVDSSGASTSNALVWADNAWSQGANNVYPRGSTNTSTFFVLDSIVEYFANATLFPNLKEIVVAGHSMGGQVVQRYAAVGPILQTRVPVVHWVGNPNSYSWFIDTRLLSTAACSIYDDWKNGFASYSPSMTYGASLVAQGRDAVLANMRSKRIAWAHSLLDHGDASEECGPFTQGLDRNERFYNFIAAFQPYCNSSTTCHTVDYVNAGHVDLDVLSSSAAKARFFTDNFNGTGTRAYDFWYPRQQSGDDPYPNPAQVNTPLVVNQGTFAGQMTYRGCYANQSPGVFTKMAYNNNSNSVNFCTNACYQAKYAIAAMQNSTQCYCGNSISKQVAVPVIYSSCYQACPGNSSQTCGGPGRLSLYSASAPSFT